MTRDNKSELPKNDEICQHIGRAIKFQEYGFGCITEFWKNAGFWIALFWDVKDLQKTCILGCRTFGNGRIHLILTEDELIHG